MRKVKNVVALLLVLGLLFGTMPVTVSAAPASAADRAIVLPAGEMLDDESLAEVTGEGWPVYVLGAVAGYVGTKLADAVWDRYVDPWLQDTVFPWIEEQYEALTGGSKKKD